MTLINKTAVGSVLFIVILIFCISNVQAKSTKTLKSYTSCALLDQVVSCCSSKILKIDYYF
jgi:hypothetical protein